MNIADQLQIFTIHVLLLLFQTAFLHLLSFTSKNSPAHHLYLWYSTGITWKLPPKKLPPGWFPPHNFHLENFHQRKFPPRISPTWTIPTQEIPTRTNPTQGNSHPDNSYPGKLPPGQLLPRKTPTQENFHPENSHPGKIFIQPIATPIFLNLGGLKGPFSYPAVCEKRVLTRVKSHEKRDNFCSLI